jgi:predicted XRE-type DNA-binding protein
MGKITGKVLVTDEIIMRQIYLVRNQKVMLDRDLAELYGVETKRLKEAVRRNVDRFPKDFMFKMNKTEFEILRSQFVSSNSDNQGGTYMPIFYRTRCNHALLHLKQQKGYRRKHPGDQDLYKNA